MFFVFTRIWSVLVSLFTFLVISPFVLIDAGIRSSLNTLTSFFCTHYCEKLVRTKFRNYGIVVGGKDPWDAQVYNPNFYLRVALNPPVGLGEAYMEGWWAPNDLQAFFHKLLCGKDFIDNDPWMLRSLSTRNFFRLLFKNLHADNHLEQLTSEMYALFLDSTMNYTCAYWKNADNLEDAQKDKMELLAQKLKLQSGMTVLDIGCGWGSLAQYLASKYHVHVVGCTFSPEQAEFASMRCQGHDVEIKLMYYRDIKGKFDRVVSVGRFENVGESEYRKYFKIATDCLKDDGLFVLQTVGLAHNNIRLIEPWVEKYIFPHRELPDHTHITKYMEDLLIIEDWQNMGYHYYRTFDAWLKNLQVPKLEKKYGDRCYRMWTYYMHGAAASFKTRRLQAWQIVFTKSGFAGGYDGVR